MNGSLENGETLACHCPEASSNRKGLGGSPLPSQGQCCCCCKWERSVLKNETHPPEFRRNNNLINFPFLYFRSIPNLFNGTAFQLTVGEL